MIELNPRLLLDRLASDLPVDLHPYMLVVGSLAAAYHHRGQLARQGVATKDADLVIHPAGSMHACGAIAERLLLLGWTRTDVCHPRETAEPSDTLCAIRLHPKGSDSYFVELLGIPKPEQLVGKVWSPCRLSDGWYGVPCFRFMALLEDDRRSSHAGIDYASPALMVLANLLSHQTVGADRMSGHIEGRRLLRSAKDIGRVMALAWLASDVELASWLNIWTTALQRCFPTEWVNLALHAADGLREVLSNDSVLEEAYVTTSVSLLRGLNVTSDKLRITGERLINDVLDPFHEIATSEEYR